MSRTRTSLVTPLPSAEPAGAVKAPSGPSTFGVVTALAVGTTALFALQYYNRAKHAPKERQAYSTDLSTNLAYRKAADKAGRAQPPPSLLSRVSRLLRPETSVPGSELTVEVTEFVVLPENTTTNLCELALPVRGEVRAHTFTDQTYRVKVKLNTPARSGAASSHREGVSEASFTASLGRGNANPLAQAGTNPRVDDVLQNDVVDEAYFARTGNQLRFTPARCESYVLMTYDTISADEISPAVVLRECVVSPSTTAGAFVLTVSLEVLTAADDVCLQLLLPKKSQLKADPVMSSGSFGRPEGGLATELQWHAGDVVPHGRGRTLECRVEYIVPNEVLALASRSATPAGGARFVDSTDSRDPDHSMNNFSTTRSSAAWQSLLPSLTLSYSAAVAASGLSIRKIGLESASHSETETRAGARVKPAVATAASYRTMYSQVIPVEANL
jgi:hypothetical protein